MSTVNHSGQRPLQPTHEWPPGAEAPELSLALYSVLQLIGAAEPATMPRIASLARVPLADMQSASDELLSLGYLDRWTDSTIYGDGRTFWGTRIDQDGRRLGPLDTASDIYAAVHPRTLLSFVRNYGILSVKRYAKGFGVSPDKLCEAAEYLEQLGLAWLTKSTSGTRYIRASDGLLGQRKPARRKPGPKPW